MRKLLTLVVALSVAGCAPAVNLEQERAALLAADQEWSTTTKDLDKMLAGFAPDASYYPAGMPKVTGEKNLRELFGQLSKAPGFALSWTADRAEVAASGDLGVTTGNYTMTMNNAAGNPRVEKGKFVTVWKKINGAWKVTDDIGASDGPPSMSSAMTVATPGDLKWGDPPPMVPAGAKFAVVSGDPSQPVPFTIRLQLPAGYKIAPHSHPTDEHVTVLSGVFAAGMGNTFDEKGLKDFPAGSYANMASTMNHYAMARVPTVVQVHGIGPFVFTYVNPADDPSKK